MYFAISLENINLRSFKENTDNYSSRTVRGLNKQIMYNDLLDRTSDRRTKTTTNGLEDMSKKLSEMHI